MHLPSVPEDTSPYCLVIVSACLGSLLINQKYFKKSYIAYLISAILFASLGFLWNAHYTLERLSNVLPIEMDGKDFLIQGRVNALPQSSSSEAKFSLLLDPEFLKRQPPLFPKQIYLSWKSAWGKSHGIPEIIPGQTWELRVKLKRPYGALNPYTFDFERWAFHQNFGATGRVVFGTLIKEREIFWTEFGLAMEYRRWQLRKKIQRALPDDARYGGVIAALVMGDQNAIDQEDWRVFNITGIGHLISISGLHVTMLAGLGSGVAAFLWRRRSLPLIIPVVKVAALAGFLTAFLYAWLAGFQIPAQRTMYMVGIVAFALWSGRNPRSFDIWWWALAFVLFLDPMAPYTPGFWLSFGAVAAILFAMKDSDGLLGIPTGKELELNWKARVKKALGEACRVQTVVTVALLPLTLYWFYQVSTVSPLANAIAIPLVSYVVTPLAISGALLPELLGKWLLLGAHISMEGLAALLQWFAAWKWSVMWSHQPHWLILLISCVGIVIAIRPGPISNTWVSRVLGILMTLSVFLKPVFFDRLMLGDFRVTALDIGQGTAVLIQTANRNLLYDTGPTYGKKDDAGKRIVLPFLRGSGITKIDRMVISHSDSDHVGGALSLLEAIQVESMIGSLPSNNALLRNLRSKKVPSLPCRYGQHWEWDDVAFHVWHPHETTLFQSAYSMKPNEMSCVLEIRNASTSFWLTGDVEKQGESAIVGRLSTKALKSIAEKNLVFMAPHHGSKTSSSVELLEGLNPDIAFAQNAYKNRYGHPHSSVVTRYKDLNVPLFQTALTGAQIWTADKQFMSDKSPSFWRILHHRLWHRPIPSSVQ